MTQEQMMALIKKQQETIDSLTSTVQTLTEKVETYEKQKRFMGGTRDAISKRINALYVGLGTAEEKRKSLFKGRSMRPSLAAGQNFEHLEKTENKKLRRWGLAGGVALLALGAGVAYATLQDQPKNVAAELDNSEPAGNTMVLEANTADIGISAEEGERTGPEGVTEINTDGGFGDALQNVQAETPENATPENAQFAAVVKAPVAEVEKDSAAAGGDASFNQDIQNVQKIVEDASAAYDEKVVSKDVRVTVTVDCDSDNPKYEGVLSDAGFTAAAKQLGSHNALKAMTGGTLFITDSNTGKTIERLIDFAQTYEKPTCDKDCADVPAPVAKPMLADTDLEEKAVPPVEGNDYGPMKLDLHGEKVFCSPINARTAVISPEGQKALAAERIHLIHSSSNYSLLEVLDHHRYEYGFTEEFNPEYRTKVEWGCEKQAYDGDPCTGTALYHDEDGTLRLRNYGPWAYQSLTGTGPSAENRDFADKVAGVLSAGMCYFVIDGVTKGIMSKGGGGGNVPNTPSVPDPGPLTSPAGLGGMSVENEHGPTDNQEIETSLA